MKSELGSEKFASNYSQNKNFCLIIRFIWYGFVCWKFV